MRTQPLVGKARRADRRACALLPRKSSRVCPHQKARDLGDREYARRDHDVVQRDRRFRSAGTWGQSLTAQPRDVHDRARPVWASRPCQQAQVSRARTHIMRCELRRSCPRCIHAADGQRGCCQSAVDSAIISAIISAAPAALAGTVTVMSLAWCLLGTEAAM